MLFAQVIHKFTPACTASANDYKNERIHIVCSSLLFIIGTCDATNIDF